MKTIIQVPIEGDILVALDELSRAQKVSRAAVIREACRRYLRQAEAESLDRSYVDGYRRVPEEAANVEARIALASETLADEPW